MKVLNQKPITIVNKCGAIFNEELLKKAMLWYADKPVTRLKSVFMFGRYPAVSIYFEKIHIHRLLMNYWSKEDICSENCVHHRNGNRLDSRIENLEIMNISLHQSIHNKGKKLSEKHKEAIRMANYKRTGSKMKRKYKFTEEDMMKIIRGDISKNQLATKYGCIWETVSRHYEEFIFENKDLLK